LEPAPCAAASRGDRRERPSVTPQPGKLHSPTTSSGHQSLRPKAVFAVSLSCTSPRNSRYGLRSRCIVLLVHSQGLDNVSHDCARLVFIAGFVYVVERSASGTVRARTDSTRTRPAASNLACIFYNGNRPLSRVRDAPAEYSGNIARRRERRQT